ncbi:MAG: hypothetical protein AAF063_17455 [Cyanobacteria bacterium J06643_5]
MQSKFKRRLKKEDEGVVVVQCYLTSEERQSFKSKCRNLGLDMANVLREFAISFINEK